LALLGGREDVDDAVDGGRRVLGVESRKDEVAGLGSGQRRRDRLEVSHLAEEDHVGVLAERAAQSVGERRCVRAELALVDDAPLVAVQELDRILDRDDVLGLRAVDLVDQGGERRRLPRAGRPRDEHETARLVAELVEGRREAELLETLQVGGNEAERACEALALGVDVDAEAREPGDRVREVDLAVELESLLLLAGDDAVQQLAGGIRGEHREALQAFELTSDPQGRMGPNGYVQVGRVVRDHLLEQRVD
jgi:hypothetical protein